MTASTNDTRDQKYSYDGLHRLKNVLGGTYNTGTGAIDSRNFEQDWTLDQLGNWSTFKERDTDTGSNWDLDQDRDHNEVNELTEFTTTSWVDPAHDDAGNMTTIPQPLAPSSSFTLKYDAWNRMVEVSDTSGAVATYEYDGLGQRIRTDIPGGTSEDRDFYYNDQWQLLTEVKDGTVEAIYHWHPFYIDALAVRMTADDTHFFLQDANFNVTAAVDDATNAVVERYAYTPYGKVSFLNASFGTVSASAIGNTHLYTGREIDPETGLQLNRNRFYVAHLGRWVNRDPIGYDAGTFSLYEYVRSRSTMGLDATGLAFYVVGDDIPSTGANGDTNIQRCCASACGCNHTDIYDDNGPVYGGFGGGYPPGTGGGGLPGGGQKITKLRRCNSTYYPPPAAPGQIPGWGGITLPNKLKYPTPKDCSQATEADIQACLRARPAPPGKPGPIHNCQTDVEDAAKDCCLCGFSGLGLRPKPGIGF